MAELRRDCVCNPDMACDKENKDRKTGFSVNLQDLEQIGGIPYVIYNILYRLSRRGFRRDEKISINKIPMETATKKCAKCGRELPVEEFHKSKSSKDGLYSYCKECTREIGKIKTEKKRIAAKYSNSVIPKNFFRQSTGGVMNATLCRNLHHGI